jgi:HAD superfamily hydrolase (TIGR01490 family)
MRSSVVGAFFDVDGTLIPPPSLECRFVEYVFAHAPGGANTLRWFSGWAKAFLLHPCAAVDRNKFYLAGLPASMVTEWADSAEAQSLHFFADGLERLAWHIAQGHRVAVVSGTLAPLARAITRQLPGMADVIATELVTTAGNWTGELVGEHISGAAKARAVTEFAGRQGLALDESYAYGDRVSDLPMLESVGHAVAVNPGSRLERAARLRGWPVCEWRLSPSRSPEHGTGRLEERSQHLSLEEAE